MITFTQGYPPDSNYVKIRLIFRQLLLISILGIKLGVLVILHTLHVFFLYQLARIWTSCHSPSQGMLQRRWQYAHADVRDEKDRSAFQVYPLPLIWYKNILLTLTYIPDRVH